MDESDLKIIAILLRDSRTPLSEMAAALGISQPAVQKRMVKLKEGGIITGSTAVLNTSLMGWKRALVALNARRADYAALLAAVQKLPFVRGVYQATGPYSIVVELLGPVGVINAVMAHAEKMRGVVDCCPISLAERVA